MSQAYGLKDVSGKLFYMELCNAQGPRLLWFFMSNLILFKLTSFKNRNLEISAKQDFSLLVTDFLQINCQHAHPHINTYMHFSHCPSSFVYFNRTWNITQECWNKVQLNEVYSMNTESTLQKFKYSFQAILLFEIPREIQCVLILFIR